MIFEVSEGWKIIIFEAQGGLLRAVASLLEAHGPFLSPRPHFGTPWGPKLRNDQDDGPHGGGKSAPEAPRGPSGHRFWEVCKGLLGWFLRSKAESLIF